MLLKLPAPIMAANNNIQGHICYGLRFEKNRINFAAFAGPSYAIFVTGTVDTAGVSHPVINRVLGGYLCVQTVYKFKYDVGIGLELFADLSALQQMYGGKLIIYFSGAYRGEKRGLKSKNTQH